MKKKLSFLARIRYAQLFVGAREDLVRKNYRHAMTRLDKMLRMYDEERPSDGVPIKANIMYGLVAWNLGEFDLVYSSCRIALDQINAELSSRHGDPVMNELRYLRGYCKNLVAFADAEGGVNTTIDFGDLSTLRFPDYDLARVSSLVKRTFPIDDTNWWRGVS